MTIEERALARAAELRRQAEQIKVEAERQMSEIRIEAERQMSALLTAAAELEALTQPAPVEDAALPATP